MRRKLKIFEEWKSIVSHTWSGAYLIKNSGRHYRKAMQILSKSINTGSDWTGHNIWGSPIVALAPPPNFLTQRRSARLSVSKGAGDAMISHPHFSEIRDGSRH